MPTQRWRIRAGEKDSAAQQDAIARAAALLRAGQLVAFPTETVYGLGANAFDADAVAAIFAAKQRPAWDPVIVHIADTAMLREVTAPLTPELEQRVTTLARAFWPGPLTLLLPRSSRIPGSVTAGRPLVGVRMPSHPVAAALIAAAGVPIAAPSANRFGHVSPTTADHVLADLDGLIPAILDAGPCRIGVESTVLDAAPPQPVVYRPGGITREQIASALNTDVVFYRETNSESPDSLPSPGVGIRHYAPRATLLLVEDPDALLRATQNSFRPGVMLPDGWEAAPGAVVYRWGAWENPATLAARLYDGLRSLDAQQVDAIVCPLPPESDTTQALRDRLQKAARKSPAHHRPTNHLSF